MKKEYIILGHHSENYGTMVVVAEDGCMDYEAYVKPMYFTKEEANNLIDKIKNDGLSARLFYTGK